VSDDRGAAVRDERAGIRQRIWDRLRDEGWARFPYPPHGRIPNFVGAEEAAERLLDAAPLAGARRIKVNPDAPQLAVRAGALARGITVFVPTPRLRGGFRRLDPAEIPEHKRREAASVSKGTRWSEPVALDDLPELDALVVGSVAVSRAGARLGKGEGYADLEYAILRELGHPAVPVATTVHPAQIVDAVPREDTDLPIAWIVTPEDVFEVDPPPAAPEGIDWERLPDERVEAMPVLVELRARRRG
jgi:5-formyltetrahydrofolate cyclo-ligase